MSAKLHALVIPKYGMVMTEGVLAAWHVEEGSEIKPGDELIDIETEKITNAYESQVGGILRRRVAQEGQTLPVGALFGVIAEASIPDPEIDAFIEDFQANFIPLDAGARGPLPEVINAGACRIRYLRIGEEGGVPVLLLHGFGADLNNWLFNQQALAVDRAVYALDLPGHGGSQKSVGTGEIPILAGMVYDFLSALAINKAHMVGHSLGGGIALWLALDRPELVASLTLISPVGLGSEINAEFIHGLIQAERRKEMKAVLQQLFADPNLVSRDMVMGILNAKRIDGAVDCLHAIAQAVFAHGRQSLVLSGRLSELTIPTQVIWGTEDRIVPIAHADRVSDNIAVHHIKDAGHMAHMEQASEVNQLIRDLIIHA